ncbi:MAG: DUF4234 domain-containing protein [Butyrivibrio sp.]|nr:DUF4234 domain-containing protein [Butyrivibrio sp.]
MFCKNCGTQIEPGIRFCPACGAAVENNEAGANTNPQDQPIGFNPGNNAAPNPYANQGYQNNQGAYQYNQGTYQNSGYQSAPYSGYVAPITERNIVLAIILSFVTCGIYSFYWIYKMNEEVNTLSGEQYGTNGILVILFSILTCGIYSLYWLYKMGSRCDIIMNDPNGGRGVLYLILSFIGLSIVSMCLIQDTINKAVRR